eukprot:GDKJ01036961.1.p1 GENE.GDKJ01036961.1~~GDKJ01036961.1.p1  ORF type:complete len:301 (-),score=84.08 GDKJ01036961.1:111-959(-)
MGHSMASHILRGGYQVTCYNRTASRCDSLRELGATVASSPKEVAENSDVVFTIVGYPSDVESVINGPNGVLEGLCEGGIVVDMTTSTPSLARRLADIAKLKGVASLDAPVSGGDIGARNATLSIMCGGDVNAFEKVKPIFELMGKNINHMGDAGAGQHTKMCNQLLIASCMLGVAEGLIYAKKAGLDQEKVIAAISTGAAGSWSLSNLGPRMLRRDFAPGFAINHFVKDLSIAEEESKAMGLEMPGLAAAKKLYEALKSGEMGDRGTQAILLAYEQQDVFFK